LNTKNKRKELEEAGKIEGPIAQITREEIKKQLEKMKNGKAAGPYEFPMEIVKKLGDLGLDWITAVLKEVQDEGRYTRRMEEKQDYINIQTER